MSRPSVCASQEAPGTAHSPLLTWTTYLLRGRDHFGRFIVEELAAAGIEEGVTVLPEEPTGITIAFRAPGRDRTFLSLLGSLEAFGRCQAWAGRVRGLRSRGRVSSSYPVQLSDTTGAGDSFNCGLMYALSAGAEWLEALQFATRLASSVVFRTSAYRYPTREVVIPLTQRPRQ